jgi:nucleoside-diphosphate-sugar epimerase
MKVLLTGSSGFLGKQIKSDLIENGVSLVTLGRDDRNDIIQDISKPFELTEKFDLIIHAAGKAHSIPKAPSEIADFFNVNTNGTSNLLNALNNNPPKLLVFISTVAVYGLDEGENITEKYPLNGETPYARSKIEAEKIVQDWCRINKTKFLILRLPLVTGNNPPGNLSAMINAIKRGYYFRVGNGSAKRSMISAHDVAAFIRHAHDQEGIYNLTDGIHPNIAQTDKHLADLMNKRIWELPLWIFKLLGIIGGLIPGFPLNSNRLQKLTATLTFNNSKALALGWKPTSALEALTFEKS